MKAIITVIGKDTVGILAKVYRIEKKAGYDQEDLSTIRTIITPIK